jgi:hypothetical protein
MNQIPKTIRPLEALSWSALSGVETLGAILNVRASDFSILGPLVYDVFGRPADPTATPPLAEIQGKQPLYLEAKALHARARASLRAAVTDGYDFMAHAVNTLKGTLGRRWNERWESLGFTGGSLRLPRKPLPVLTLLGAYFRAHPEREAASLNLTSAHAEAMKAAIVAAQTAADAAHIAETSAKQARDKAVRKLWRQLAALRDELGALIEPDDARWYGFGFRRPVDRETPDLVEKVDLRLGGAGEVVASWPKARLADNYRVSWRLTGSTDTPTQVGLVNDPQKVIAGLPHGVSITVIVTARNAAGESAPMEEAIAVP